MTILRLSVRNLRAGIGRLLLTIVAIATSIGFVTAAFVLADSFNRSLSADVEGEQAFDLVRNIVLGFAGITLFAALFIIANTFAMVVAQRIRQIGMLRALGASTGQIRLGVLIEAALVGLVGSLAGLALGVAGGAAVTGLVDSQIEDVTIELVVAIRTVAVALVVGVGATVLAALAPTMAAGRVSPMAALRYEGLRRSSSRWRMWLGAPMLALGAGLVAAGLFVGGQSSPAVVAELGVGGLFAFAGMALLSALFVGPIVSVLGRAPILAGLLLASGVVLIVVRVRAIIDANNGVYLLWNPWPVGGAIVWVLSGVLIINLLSRRQRINPGRAGVVVTVLALPRGFTIGGELVQTVDYQIWAGWIVACCSVSMLAAWVRGRPASGTFSSVAGLPGDLARRSAMANPSRTAATATALIIGLALIVAVSTLGQSVRAGVTGTMTDTLTADRIVVAEQPLSASVVDLIAETDGVAAVSSARSEWMSLDGEDLWVTTLSNPTDRSLVDIGLTGDGNVAPMAPGRTGILVHEQEAEQRSLAIGDVVDVELPTGTSEPLTVAGLFERDLNGNRWIVDSALLEGDVLPDDGSYELLVAFAEDRPDGLVGDLRRSLNGHDAVILEPAEYIRDVIGTGFAVTLAVVNGLLGMTILVALVGVVNTISLSVLERTREIGMLRAVGMNRAQVSQVIRWESVLICLFGAALGVAMGLTFGVAAVLALPSDIPAELELPVTTVAAVFAATAVAGAMAALLPARRASRVDVLGAISGR